MEHLTVYLTPERSRMLMDIPGDTINTLFWVRIANAF